MQNEEGNTDKPLQTRDKLVIAYVKGIGYPLHNDEEQSLLTFNVSLEEFKRTSNQILADISLRPEDYKFPFYRKAVHLFQRLIVVLLYAYVCLLILQLALFNLVLLGIFIIYFFKLWSLFKEREDKIKYEYQNQRFIEFIEAENKRYYLNLKVELIAGDNGLWIEIQLPDNVDDFKEKLGSGDGMSETAH